MELHLKIIGLILICLSLIHIVFPKYFEWGKELLPLSLINRQMMYVHTFFVAIMVFLMGLLSLLCASELINTPLGRKISLGLGFFWGLRLFFQFFVYSSLHWKGKRFETIIHIIFSLLWIYLTVVFMLIYLGQYSL